MRVSYRIDPQLETSLRNTLNEWSENMDWNGDFYVPDYIVEHMTDACVSILETLQDIQNYHVTNQTSFEGITHQ